MKNYEIPIGFPNIRSSNFSNILRFVLNGVSYNAIITQQNYSSISTLLTALNASIVTALTSTGFSVVLSVNTSNNIIITSTGAFSSYSIIQSTLSNILNINSAIFFYLIKQREHIHHHLFIIWVMIYIFKCRTVNIFISG